MSWQNRYLLPWDRLDLEKIEAAARHVVAGPLPLRGYEIEVRDPDSVRVYFTFDAGLERRRGLSSDVGRTFELYGIADTDEGLVDIGFAHTPADPKLGLPSETSFEFYSGISGNSIYSGVGIEIAEQIGRFFGVKCEPM